MIKGIGEVDVVIVGELVDCVDGVVEGFDLGVVGCCLVVEVYIYGVEF